jgi:hypothetical protein
MDGVPVREGLGEVACERDDVRACVGLAASGSDDVDATGSSDVADAVCVGDATCCEGLGVSETEGFCELDATCDGEHVGVSPAVTDCEGDGVAVRDWEALGAWVALRLGVSDPDAVSVCEGVPLAVAHCDGVDAPLADCDGVGVCTWEGVLEGVAAWLSVAVAVSEGVADCVGVAVRVSPVETVCDADGDCVWDCEGLWLGVGDSVGLRVADWVSDGDAVGAPDPVELIVTCCDAVVLRLRLDVNESEPLVVCDGLRVAEAVSECIWDEDCDALAACVGLAVCVCDVVSSCVHVWLGVMLGEGVLVMTIEVVCVGDVESVELWVCDQLDGCVNEALPVGVPRLLGDWVWLNEYPWLPLCVWEGVVVWLAVTDWLPEANW